MHYSSLGYSSYSQYLNGNEWKKLHDFYYKHCGSYRCGICGIKTDLVLHKRSYEHLSLQSLRKKFWFNFLIAWYLKRLMSWLCHKCHKQVHFYKNGTKVPMVYNTLYRREKLLLWQHRSWQVAKWLLLALLVVSTLIYLSHLSDH